MTNKILTSSIFFIFIFTLSCARSQDKVEAICGDNIMDPDSEECDGEDTGNVSCIELGYYGGLLRCTSDCKLDFSQCQADGKCGDGVLHTSHGEQCDTDELNGATCESEGFGPGTLSCNSLCEFDTSECTAATECGNGIIEDNEQCDTNDLNNETCSSLGLGNGDVSCNSDCHFNTSGCSTQPVCGDQVVEGGEECDTSVPAGIDCTDYGYYFGSVSCNSNSCTIDTSNCNGECGDNIANGSEECDSNDFNNSTCADYGYWTGSLLCNLSCQVNTQNCENTVIVGNGDNEYIYGSITDSTGGVILTGLTTGSFDGNGNTGGDDIILIKYDANGNKLWSAQKGSSGNDFGSAVAVDQSGNVYVTGKIAGAVDGQTFSGSTDIALIKYNSTGAWQWTRLLGTPAEDYGRDITIDPSGNIFVVGNASGSLTGNTNAGGSDFFIAKYNSSGTLLWVKQYGSSENDYGQSIEIVNNSYIYIGGFTGGTLGTSSAGGNDCFVSKYDMNGNQQWITQYGSSGLDQINSISVDSNGSVYVAGYTDGSVAGNQNLGGFDILFTKLTSSGALVWTTQWGSSSDEQAWGVTTSSSGDIYISGYSQTGLGGSTYLGGDTDAFITKYNSSGVSLWTHMVGGTEYDIGVSLDFSSNGKLFLTGFTLSSFDSQSNSGGSDLFIKNINPI